MRAGFRGVSQQDMSSSEESSEKSGNVISLFHENRVVDENRVVSRRDLSRVTTTAEELFSKVEVVRRDAGRNQRFFRVTMRVARSPSQLIGEVLDLGGSRGSINGVENDETQFILRAGDEVILMLWGPGVAENLEW